MKLSELCKFQSIIIQCHDNPDVDAIASAYALYRYFLSKGKKVKIVYGGKFFITKCNIELMISQLDIPIEHVDNLNNFGKNDELLLTVDCQYGEGNVTKFKSQHIAIIDHHADTYKNIELSEIRSSLGSCSTLVWNMLSNEGFDVNEDKSVATALYYGLFMDTGGFAEIVHPLDRDLIDCVFPDMFIFNKLKNTNLSLQELETTGIALIRHICDTKNKYALVKAHPCDPNILGIISDLLLQVNDIEICVIYNELPFGYKFSVRSCRMDVRANEFAEYITNGIGNGGGHKDKAGGFINKEKFQNLYNDMGMDEYMLDIEKKYFNSYDILYTNDFKPDFDEFERYQKKKISLGYVVSSDVLEEGSIMILRTMEGDVNVRASKDIYIMIDIEKNVYPIEREVFEKKYEVLNERFILDYEYTPKIKDVLHGNVIEIQNYAKKCTPYANKVVYAKQLKRPLKVFAKWDYESYMFGRTGDYLVFSKDNPNDVYIVKDVIMAHTYECIEG